MSLFYTIWMKFIKILLEYFRSIFVTAQAALMLKGGGVVGRLRRPTTPPYLLAG
jgi:hypothetical protein